MNLRNRQLVSCVSRCAVLIVLFASAQSSYAQGYTPPSTVPMTYAPIPAPPVTSPQALNPPASGMPSPAGVYPSIPVPPSAVPVLNSGATASPQGSGSQEAAVGTSAKALSLEPQTPLPDLSVPPGLAPSAIGSPAAGSGDAQVDDLDAKSLRRPVWYYPWAWFPWDGWTNSAELGMNGSGGNANSFSFQTGARFKRATDQNLFDFRISLNRTQANGVEKQNNALAYLDFDRFFGESRWSAFLKQGIEYDRFKAFDMRYNINPGLAYRFLKTEKISLQGRFGAGTSREFGGPDDRWVPEALFGASYEHQWNKRNKWIAKIDYFPEWGDFNNYRIVSDASWEMLWDEVGNLSLKLGAVDRYDSTPNGRLPNDLTYSMLLLYKF